MATIGILVGTKGRGSNLRAIVEACRSGAIPASVSAVVSPVLDSPAVEWARENGVPVRVVERLSEGYAGRLEKATRDCDLLCLAGYMWLLPEAVLSAHPGNVLNIHPALLPKFGGKGMYGRRVHEAVLESGERESGCTVHFVDEEYDSGAIVLQAKCPIEDGETPESLAQKVLSLEHRTYPEAIRMVLEQHG